MREAIEEPLGYTVGTTKRGQKEKHVSLCHIKNSAESINSYLRYAPWKLAIFIRECVAPVLASVVTSVTDRDAHVAAHADSSLRA